MRLTICFYMKDITCKLLVIRKSIFTESISCVFYIIEMYCKLSVMWKGARLIITEIYLKSKVHFTES